MTVIIAGLLVALIVCAILAKLDGFDDTQNNG
jgi:hypothetical protein